MKAVIFDMDGVIIDSARVSDRLLIECGAKHGAQITQKDLRDLRGVGAKEFWAEIIVRYNIPYSCEHLCCQYDVNEEIRRYSNLELVDGVKDLIEAFSAEGRPIALATSAERIRMDAVLNLFSLFDLFDVTVCSDEVKYSKPDPQVFLLAAQKMNVNSKDCFVIEDSRSGILAAHKAGMMAVGFYGLLDSWEHLAEADVLINSFDKTVFNVL